MFAGIKKAEHYEAYKAALESAKKLTLRYLKFLFIGAPRSGKSTMRRRMLHEIVNLSSLGQPSVSTGVAETYDVFVKKMSSESAAISHSQWWSLQKQSSNSSLPYHRSEGELNYLTHIFYSLIYKPTPGMDPATSTEAHTSAATNTPIVEVDTNTDVNIPIFDKDMKQETIRMTEKSVADKSATDEPAIYGVSEQKEINTAFERLTSILQSDSPEDLQNLLEALTLINVMDIGGQPEFLDMLPALTIGAALYLIFFRLDRDIHEHYPVTFHAPGDTHEMTLETSYSMEEVIHQALASIACFSGQVAKGNATSCAILAGTHKDQVKANDIALQEKAICENFMNVEMYESLLLSTDKGKPFFAVDNMNGTDESEMSKIRHNIEEIVKTHFAELPTPASWLMFRIVLHLLNKPVVTFAQCEEIAHRLSMHTPVQEALWFFHHSIGSLLYYPDIPSVKDLVICTPQVIFDSVTTMIIENFQHGNYHISRKVLTQFQQTGLFSLSDIGKRTEQNRKTHLSPVQLVDALKYNSILAEVNCSEEEATCKEQVESKLIIPAVLKHASHEELKPPILSGASPIMIRFQGGFVPFGVFSASIARLVACAHSLSPRWNLHSKEVKRNKVKFIVAKAFITTLISRPGYIEIQIEKYPRARCKHTL